MIDVANAIAGVFDEAVIASNPSGVFQEDISRLRSPCARKTVPILTKNMIYHFWLQDVRAPIRRFFWLLMLPMEPLIFLYNLAICLGLLLRTKPALVICCNGGYPGSRSTLIMIIAARLIGVPSVLSIVSTPHQPSTIFRSYSWMVDRLIHSSTRLVIVNSRMIKRLLVEERKFPGEKIEVIYNGLEDNDLFNTRAGESRLADGRVVVGCVCRVEYAKGVTYLFDAYLGVRGNMQDSQLILAGDGDAYEVIRRRIADLGLEGSIVLLGQVKSETVDELVNGFDIYVLPSLHEGFPYSILEAMRAGCAIIATSVGGIPEAINDGEHGILVEARSSEKLGEALRRLVSDHTLRKQLGMNARNRFLREFRLQNMHQKLLEVFLQTGLVTQRERL